MHEGAWPSRSGAAVTRTKHAVIAEVHFTRELGDRSIAHDAQGVKTAS
jgi:hypothetical protein